MDLTIFEVHLDGSTFNAPFASGEESPDAGDEREDEESDAGAAGSGLDPRPLLVVAVLLGLALLARYLRSDEPEEAISEAEESLDEIEVGGA
jgi:hypothetical protein